MPQACGVGDAICASCYGEGSNRSRARQPLAPLRGGLVPRASEVCTTHSFRPLQPFGLRPPALQPFGLRPPALQPFSQRPPSLRSCFLRNSLRSFRRSTGAKP